MKPSDVDDVTASEHFTLDSNTFDELLRTALGSDRPPSAEEVPRAMAEEKAEHDSAYRTESRRKEFDDLLSRFKGYRALNATTAALKTHGDRAREFVMQRLRELVAQCSDWFLASSAGLFLFDEDDESLKAVHLHRVKREYHRVIRLDHETSMVARIARDRKAALIRDAKKAEEEGFFLPTPGLPSKSAMGVPLIIDDGRLIGVLHLESLRNGAFSAALLPDLAAEAAEMVENLLLLESLDRTDLDWCPWHPQLHVWDFSRLLRAICHAIAEALDSSNAIECAILEVDPWNKTLNALATSGHMTEYFKDQMLGFESFNGSVATCPAGSYGRANPQEDHSSIWVPTAKGYEEVSGHRFLMDFKRTFLSFEDGVAVPIHTGARGKGRARYVLSIYAYTKEAVDSLPSGEELVQIAALLGDVLGACVRLRTQLAVAHFTQVFTKRSEATDFNSLRKELEEIYALDEVRVYVPDSLGEGLVALTEKGEVSSLDWQDGDSAYLMHLFRRPGMAVRVNDARSQQPPNLPADDVPGGRPWTDAEHRRFLDVGVGDNGSDGMGVIRLVRRAYSRPFSVGAEETLLALLPVFTKALGECAHTGGHGTASRTRFRPDSEEVRRILPDLRSPVSVLKALADHYGPFATPVQAGFITKHHHVEPGPLGAVGAFRWHSYLALQHRSSPTNPWDLVHRPALDWQHLIERGEPMTFNLGDANSSGTSGIRMPLLTWTEGRYVVEGVLALDFRGKIDWKEDDLVLLFHAARQISDVMGRTVSPAIGSGRPATPTAFDEKCLQSLLDLPKGRFSAARSAVGLYQWRHGQDPSWVVLGSQFDSGPPEVSWLRVPTDEHYDLAEFGVDEGEIDGRLVYRIPLRVSPCVTGRFICDLGSEAAEARKRGTAKDRLRVLDDLGRITGGINRSWSRAVGPQVAQNVSFDWDDSGPGSELVYWKPRVNWSPSFIERAQNLHRANASAN